MHTSSLLKQRLYSRLYSRRGKHHIHAFSLSVFTSDLSMEYSTLYIARGTREAEEAKRVDTLMISITLTYIAK